MKRMLAILLAILPLSAKAGPVIADLSYHMIAINSSFKGTNLLMFGSRSEAGDIVITVRGPEADFMVRRKERHAGIWINSAEVKFQNAPIYYAVASTKPLPELDNNGLLGRLGIGTDYMTLATDSVRRDVNDFRSAFKEDRQKYNLYTPVPKPISFMGDALFKTFIDFPEKIPSGDYTAEVYLIKDGQLLSMQSTPIEVRKEGMDAVIYNIAYRWPLTYGIMAVAMAFILGWTAAHAFRRI